MLKTGGRGNINYGRVTIGKKVFYFWSRLTSSVNKLCHIPKCSKWHIVYHTAGINWHKWWHFSQSKMASKMAATLWKDTLMSKACYKGGKPDKSHIISSILVSKMINWKCWWKIILLRIFEIWKIQYGRQNGSKISKNAPTIFQHHKKKFLLKNWHHLYYFL